MSSDFACGEPARFKVIRTTDVGARPDMRIVVADDLEKLDDPLAGAPKIMREIAKIAGRRG